MGVKTSSLGSTAVVLHQENNVSCDSISELATALEDGKVKGTSLDANVAA